MILHGYKPEDGSFLGVNSISDKVIEKVQADLSGGTLIDDFDFVEDVSDYVYTGTTFTLVTNWEQIKADRVEAERIANLPSLEDAKQNAINAIHKKDDDMYDAYLAAYPKKEAVTFEPRNTEALAYSSDNTTPTPTIDAFINFDVNKVLEDEIARRVDHINSVLPKATFLARSAGMVVEARDAIKACVTLEELEILLESLG